MCVIKQWDDSDEVSPRLSCSCIYRPAHRRDARQIGQTGKKFNADFSEGLCRLPGTDWQRTARAGQWNVAGVWPPRSHCVYSLLSPLYLGSSFFFFFLSTTSPTDSLLFSRWRFCFVIMIYVYACLYRTNYYLFKNKRNQDQVQCHILFLVSLRHNLLNVIFLFNINKNRSFFC